MATYELDKAGMLIMWDDATETSYSFSAAVEKFGEADVRELKAVRMYCIRARGQYWDFARWREVTGISQATITRRIQNGWGVLDAVNTPGSSWRANPESKTVRTCGRPAQLWQCGERTLSIAQWSQE